jgi:hypothetical protein
LRFDDPKLIQSLRAFCRKEPSVRFVSLAINAVATFGILGVATLMMPGHTTAPTMATAN